MIPTAAAFRLVVATLALACLTLLAACFLGGYAWGHDRGITRGRDQGRHQVCVELAAGGGGIGGASSISPDGETERTGC